jgi:hypothetical protein
LTISRYAGIPPETRMTLMGGDRDGTRPQVKHTHCLVS